MQNAPIEKILIEIASKRLKGQWSAVLKACEKLARLCDMGLRQQDMVDKKLRVVYWTAMAESKIEHSGEMGRALDCLKEAGKSELTGDSEEWVEWRIMLAKYLLAATNKVMQSGPSQEGDGNHRGSRSFSSRQYTSVGVGEDLKPEDVFDSLNSSGAPKMLPLQRRILYNSLSASYFNPTDKEYANIEIGQHVLRTLDMMDQPSQADVLAQMLGWLDKHGYMERPLTKDMDTRVLNVWTYTVARQLLSKVCIRSLVERVRSFKSKDYTAWLQTDAVVAEACLSVELDEYERARDKLKSFLTALFPQGGEGRGEDVRDMDMNLGFFPPMTKSVVIDAIARLPIIEVVLGEKAAALDTYRKCISGNSSVRAHIPVPTQVGMVFSAAMLFLSQEADKGNEVVSGNAGNADDTDDTGNLEQGDNYPLDIAFSLLQSIRHILTSSVVTEPDPIVVLPVPPSQTVETAPATSLAPATTPSNTPVNESAGVSGRPIQSARHSILNRLPNSPISPITETEFVTPGRIGVLLHVLMKKLNRHVGIDMLKWSLHNEISPSSGLLWSLGSAYSATANFKEAVSMLVQCHDVCGSSCSVSKLDVRREQEFTRIVEWLDPLPRPHLQSWLPIVLASRITLRNLGDTDKALVLVSRGLCQLFPAQADCLRQVMDITAAMETAIHSIDASCCATPPDVDHPEDLAWGWTADVLKKTDQPACNAMEACGFRELILLTLECYAEKSRDRSATAAVRRVYRRKALTLSRALIEQGLEEGDSSHVLTGEQTLTLRAAAVYQHARLLAEGGAVSTARSLVEDALAGGAASCPLQHLHVLLVSCDDPLSPVGAEELCSKYVKLYSQNIVETFSLRMTLAFLRLALGEGESAVEIALSTLNAASAMSDGVDKNNHLMLNQVSRILLDCSRVLRGVGRLNTALDAVAHAWRLCSHGDAMDPEMADGCGTGGRVHMPEALRNMRQADGWRLPLCSGWAGYDSRDADLAASVLAEYAAISALNNAHVVRESSYDTPMNVLDIALSLCPSCTDALVGQVFQLLDGSSGMAEAYSGETEYRAHESASSALRFDDGNPAHWHALSRCKEALNDTDATILSYNSVLIMSDRWGIRGWSCLS